MIKLCTAQQIISDIKRESAYMLERELCGMTGARHCVLTCGRDQGIEIALRAAGVKTGDTVACPALGGPSLLHAVLCAGVQPMFIDINPDTWMIDAQCLEYALKRRMRTGQVLPTAVIASNLFGALCEYTALEMICRRHKIALIEDMCGSTGAIEGERQSGCFGDYSIALPAGSDGVACVFCRDWSGYYRLREYAKSLTAPTMVAVDMARQSLLYLGRELKGRRRVAKEYQKYFHGFAQTQQIKSEYGSTYSSFVIELVDEHTAKITREKLEDKSLMDDSEMPLKLHELYKKESRSQAVMVNADIVAGRLLPLPIHHGMNSRVVAQIAKIAKSGNYSQLL